MENSKKNFEEILKEKVDSFAANPSEKVWEQLSLNLPMEVENQGGKNRWLLILATIVAGAMLSGLLFLYLKNAPKPPTQPDPTRVFAGYASTDVFQIQQIRNAVDLMERENKKVVLVNCQMQRCPMCAKMEAVTYKNPEIEAFIKQYFVKIDVIFSESEMTQLQDFYGLSAYPTALFLDRDGVLLDKVVGFKEPKAFLTILDNMMELEAMGQLVGL